LLIWRAVREGGKREGGLKKKKSGRLFLSRRLCLGGKKKREKEEGVSKGKKIGSPAILFPEKKRRKKGQGGEGVAFLLSSLLYRPAN